MCGIPEVLHGESTHEERRLEMPCRSGKTHRVWPGSGSIYTACIGFHTLQERHAMDDIGQGGAQEVQHGLGKTCNRGSMGHGGAA